MLADSQNLHLYAQGGKGLVNLWSALALVFAPHRQTAYGVMLDKVRHWSGCSWVLGHRQLALFSLQPCAPSTTIDGIPHLCTFRADAPVQGGPCGCHGGRIPHSHGRV